MRKQLEVELKVGIFVALGIGLVMAAILILGSTENLLTRQNRYRASFPSVEGLINGAKVVLGGIQVGTVEKIEISRDERKVDVLFSVASRYGDWIRKDSSVEIATQGVLGDKFLSLSMGTPEEAVLPNGSEMAPRAPRDISQFLSKGDQLMVNLNSIAGNLDRMLKRFEADNRSDQFFKGMAQTSKNLAEATERLNRSLEDGQLRSAIRNLNQVLGKINNGTGSLGALINDPGLYDDAKALVGEANRNRVIRNLVRQTIRKSDEAEAKAARDAGPPAANSSIHQDE